MSKISNHITVLSGPETEWWILITGPWNKYVHLQNSDFWEY